MMSLLTLAFSPSDLTFIQPSKQEGHGVATDENSNSEISDSSTVNKEPPYGNSNAIMSHFTEILSTPKLKDEKTKPRRTAVRVNICMYESVLGATLYLH
jgi:hypothetical protein